MIEATIKVTVPPEKREELLQTFKALLGPIRLERGCNSSHCYVDIEDENLIYIRVEWTNQRALGAHLRSPLFRVLTGAMKLLNNVPAISFNTIAPRQVRWL
jgi:quinol monooxygenase YgiN